MVSAGSIESTAGFRVAFVPAPASVRVVIPTFATVCRLVSITWEGDHAMRKHLFALAGAALLLASGLLGLAAAHPSRVN
jgi:hypothetical protein